MASIPGSINGVMVDLAPSAIGIGVDQRLVDGLSHCIRSNVDIGYPLQAIYISSAMDSHQSPSRHVPGKAVDISRINGKYIADGWNANAEVTAIVKAIQDAFESFPLRRENFGPHLQNKSGQPFSVGGHRDHIHLSVD